MAILNENHFLTGISGKVGNVVLKQVNGKTILCAKPNMTNARLSEKQIKCRDRFREAVAYAKGINEDPHKKKTYEHKLLKGQTVYQFAVKEYLDANKE